MRSREHRFSPSVLVGMLVIVVAMVLGLYYISERLGGGEAGETAAGADIGGPFTLTDQNGKTVTDEDFRGSLMLVYFGYTNCPDVCPLTLSTFGQALDLLGDDARDVVPVFITVDPDRDTVEHLKTYMAQFDRRIVALTGSPDAIAQAAKAYHVYFKRAEPGTGQQAGMAAGHEGHEMPGYAMDHTSIIYLMDRNGHYAAHFDQSTTPAQMAAGIAKNL